MMFDGINLLAVLGAAIASFAAGSFWYGMLGGLWARAAGLSDAERKPSPFVLCLTFLLELLMAFVLAGVIYHAGPVTPANGLLSAMLIWTGFVLTTMVVNHRFARRPLALTLIDGGHWLVVLLVQGLAIGLLS
jgi:hypothetical protein